MPFLRKEKAEITAERRVMSKYIVVSEVVNIYETSVVTSVPARGTLCVLTASGSVTSIGANSVGRTGYTVNIWSLLRKLRVESFTEDPSADLKVGRVVKLNGQYGVITLLHRDYRGAFPYAHVLYANGGNEIVPPDRRSSILPCAEEIDIASILDSLKAIKDMEPIEEK
jgi:hypothetical protein